MQTASAKQEACIKYKFPSFKNAIVKNQEKQEEWREKILNEASISKEQMECEAKPIQIHSKQSFINLFTFDPKMLQTIDQGQKYKDQCYMDAVLKFESEGRLGTLKFKPYKFGKKGVVLEIRLLKYLICKIEEGEQCELCYSNDPQLKWVYMIRSGSRIHFMHPFCVYNSNGFTVDKSTNQIDNLEWMIENIKDKICPLCSRPNASLQCAGKDKYNQPCPINYHACCLYNRKDLGEVRITPDGPLIFCSKCKQHKKKPSKILEPYSKPINKLTKTDNQDLIEEPIFNGVGEMAIKRVLQQDEVKRTLNEVKNEKLLEYFGCMTEFSNLFGSDVAKCLNPNVVKLFSYE